MRRISIVLLAVAASVGPALQASECRASVSASKNVVSPGQKPKSAKASPNNQRKRHSVGGGGCITSRLGVFDYFTVVVQPPPVLAKPLPPELFLIRSSAPVLARQSQ